MPVETEPNKPRNPNFFGTVSIEPDAKLVTPELAYESLVGVFSAQGMRFISLAQLPKVTHPMIALISLPESTVRTALRNDLKALPKSRDGRKIATLGASPVGRLLESAKRRFGIPLLGGSIREQEILIPSHEQFDSANLLIGGGICGSALLVPGSRLATSTFLGCFVAFPDQVYVESEESETPDYGAVRSLISERFEDPQLEHSLDRLDRIAEGNGRGRRRLVGAELAYTLARIGPMPRWHF